VPLRAAEIGGARREAPAGPRRSSGKIKKERKSLSRFFAPIWRSRTTWKERDPVRKGEKGSKEAKVLCFIEGVTGSI